MTSKDDARLGYDYVADCLSRMGITTFFGLLGNSNLALAAALVQRGPRFISSRHEAGAVCLAAGYAWSTGTAALVTVTHGPGLGNALPALTSAVRDRLPLVLLVGDISRDPEWNAQRASHRSMVEWTGAEFLPCAGAEFLGATVSEAFLRARVQRRPVMLNIPVELLEAPIGKQRGAPDPDDLPSPPPAAVPSRTSLERAVSMLGAARRPLILAGRGAVWADAGAELRRLAGRSGALLASSLPAKGVFGDDPRYVGVAGGYSTQLARELFAGVDCLLVFGAGLNGYTTDSGRLFPSATVIHCDIDASAHDRFHSVDVAIVGDARTVARALADALPSDGSPAWAQDGISGMVESARHATEYPDQTDTTGLDPRTFLRLLDARLGPDHQVVIDVGHFSSFPSQVLSLGSPRFFPAFGFGSVGLALATGIGAAVAGPTPTLVILGDGGALMSLSEWETLRRSAAPVVVVILNDGAYGAEIHHLRRHQLPEELAEVPPVDFAAVARSMGVRAATVTDIGHAAEVVNALPTDGPFVIDVHVTRATVADRFRGAAR